MSRPQGTTWLEKHFVWLLLIAGAALLLTNLGNIYLWQDEAETALLSQRLGTYGLPLAFDGHTLIRQAPQDVQYTSDYVWVYHPWLPFYFPALSFAALGPTTFAARLPYALAGLATVILLYYSLRHHFRDRRVAMLGSVFLLLCVPFLLHARQCKYFAFAALFTVATLDAYLWLREPERSDAALPYFILAGFCLFQSNFGAFVPLMAALGVHFLLSRPRWSEWGRLTLAAGVLVVFVLPWAIYLQTWARGRFAFDVYRFVGHGVHYVVYLTGWVFPWLLALLFLAWYLRGRWGKQRQAQSARFPAQAQSTYWQLGLTRSEFSMVDLYLLVTVLTILFLAEAFIWMYFSYIVQLVPLLAALLALTVLKIVDRWRVPGYALIVVLVATNVLQVVPYVLPLARHFKWASLAPRQYLAETDALIATAGRLRFDLADYAYELTHDYDGPDEGVVLYLTEHAAPGDVVLTNYGELPIAFYTGLDIAGGLSGFRMEHARQPEWVINRRDGPYGDEMAQVVSRGYYEAIEIPYPDILWGNRPVPEYHKFATVQNEPHVVIHRRLD
jgi:4-amino-4-deoxy-L-arabinose transferase-like glycosyltransferase